MNNVETRAIEVATEALAVVKQHVRHCEEGHRDNKAALSQLHERVDQTNIAVADVGKALGKNSNRIVALGILCAVAIAGQDFVSSAITAALAGGF